MSQPKRTQVIEMLNDFIKKAQAQKTADEAGETAHVSGKAPDGTAAAEEGAAGRERSQAVRDAVTAESVSDSGDLVGDASPKGEVVPKREPEEEPGTPLKHEQEDPGTAHVSGAPEKSSSVSDRAQRVLATIATLGVKAAQEKTAEKKVEEKKAEDEKKEEKKDTEEKPPVDAAEGSAEEKAVEKKPDEEPTEEEKEASEAGYELGQRIADILQQGNASLANSVAVKAAADADLFAKFSAGLALGTMVKKGQVPPEVLTQLLADQGVPAGGAMETGEGEGVEGVEGEEEGEEEAGAASEEDIQALAEALAAQGLTEEDVQQLAAQALSGSGITAEAAEKSSKADAKKKEEIRKIAAVLKKTAAIAKS